MFSWPHEYVPLQIYTIRLQAQHVCLRVLLLRVLNDWQVGADAGSGGASRHTRAVYIYLYGRLLEDWGWQSIWCWCNWQRNTSKIEHTLTIRSAKRHGGNWCDYAWYAWHFPLKPQHHNDPRNSPNRETLILRYLAVPKGDFNSRCGSEGGGS